METEALRILIEVVESGSIQGASRRLALTRSSIRRSLDRLEADIGAALLVRDARGLQVTAAGSVVVEHARVLVDAAHALVAHAVATAGHASGVLHVLEPVGMPVALRAQALLAMRTALPKQRVVVREVEDPLAHLHETVDVVLHDGPPPDRSTWFSRVVTRLPLRAQASAEYLSRRGVPRHVRDLADHEVLGWRRAQVPPDRWPLLAGGSHAVSPVVESPDLLMIAALAVAGGGIVLAPRTPILDESGAGQLRTVLEDQVGGEFVFRVSSRLPASVDARTRASLRLIFDLASALPE